MRDLSRALGYCRVSTQRQVSEGHGLERYIKQLKDYGLTDEQIHWDIESGASEKRKGYNRVLELVRAGKVDKIIVPCFDRFTRSALGWEVAKDELQQFGVELKFLDGGSLDLETPEGLFTSRILAAMANQLRDKNKYNATQGARFFRENRKIYKATFGFVKVGDTVEPNRTEYRNTGKSHAEIAVECIEIVLETGEISKTIERMTEKYGLERVGKNNFDDFARDITAFRRWLQNPQLCGMIRYYPHNPDKRIILESDHQGIISVETFNQLQELIKRPPRARVKYPNNPLVSLAVCGGCGSRMEKRSSPLATSDRLHEYLRCTGAYPRAPKPKVCDCRNYFKLEDAIKACIQRLKRQAKTISDGYLSGDTGEVKVPPEILELQQQIMKLKQLNDPDLKNAIITKEQRLESLIRTSEVELVADAARVELLRNLATIDGFWQKATREELTSIFHELIDKVVCSTFEGEQIFSIFLKI